MSVVDDEARVREDDGELQHLRLGDVFFPRALDLERSHEVVAVHDHVNPRVHARAEVRVDAIGVFDDKANHPPRPDEACGFCCLF